METVSNAPSVCSDAKVAQGGNWLEEPMNYVCDIMHSNRKGTETHFW